MLIGIDLETTGLDPFAGSGTTGMSRDAEDQLLFHEGLARAEGYMSRDAEDQLLFHEGLARAEGYYAAAKIIMDKARETFERGTDDRAALGLRAIAAQIRAEGEKVEREARDKGARAGIGVR